MRIIAKVGDIRRQIERDLVMANRAIHGGVTEATHSLKQRLRLQVTSAGLGRRLSNTWRDKVLPEKPANLTADGLVWTKVPHIMRPHGFGATIRARNARWMTIPTPAAGATRGGGRITPKQWEAKTGRKLRFVPGRRGREPRLVTDFATGGRLKSGAARISRGKNPKKTVTIFILRKQVILPPRMSIEQAASREVALLPSYVSRRWKKT